MAYGCCAYRCPKAKPDLSLAAEPNPDPKPNVTPSPSAILTVLSYSCCCFISFLQKLRFISTTKIKLNKDLKVYIFAKPSF